MKIDTFARALLHISLAALVAFAPMAASATTQASEPVVIGEKFQIESKVLAETRTYVIASWLE
jgi:glycine betaine/choline ABC-type transport system substrate-binding protein